MKKLKIKVCTIFSTHLHRRTRELIVTNSDILSIMMICDGSGSDTDEDDVACSEYILQLVTEDSERRVHGGSRPAKAPNRFRNMQEGHLRILDDYFISQQMVRADGGRGPVFSEREFERRFRVPRKVWDEIFHVASENNKYFQQSPDATGLLGASGLQKMVSAIRQLAYGVGADSTTEYCRISETVANRSLKEFCRSIVHCFEKDFLRLPNLKDIQKMEQQYRARGFPGAIGCIDCAGWKWKDCPVAWQGAFKGKDKVPTVRMEVLADESLRVWHFFFGQPGSRNDLNILDASPLFRAIRVGKYPPTRPLVKIANSNFDWHYFLADGIYPRWKIFAQSFADPQTKEEKNYSKIQEAVRKSVERVFGVLFQRFHILYMPCRLWYKNDMKDIINSCVILHNMIVERRKSLYVSGVIAERDISCEVPACLERTHLPKTKRDQILSWERVENIDDRSQHFELRRALVEHQWLLTGRLH